MKNILYKFLILIAFTSCQGQDVKPYYFDATGNDRYNVKTYGLKGDGVTNDYAALNTLLNTTAPSGSTIYFPSGTYSIASSVVLSDKYFHFITDGATITIGANNIQLFNISSTNATTALGSKCTFNNFVFTCSGGGGGQVGLYFSGSAGLFTVENCTFDGFGNAGVEALTTNVASTTNPSSLGGTVIGCRFYKNRVGVYLYTSGEYVQIVGCSMISNTIGIATIAGNSIIDGNTCSYNGTGLEIGNGANSAKDIVSDNHFTHNTVSLYIHDIPSTQGVYLNNNHVIVGTMSITNCASGVYITGGQINEDAYTFTSNTFVMFNSVLFTNSLANTITTTGTSPIYRNCYRINGDQATDADNATATQSFKYSLIGSATLDFGNTAAGTSSDLTITVTGAADGDPVTVGVPNGSTVANGCFTAWISAANTVTVRYSNNDLTTAYNPASGAFKVTVLKN